jgi:hypothetical protein
MYVINDLLANQTILSNQKVVLLAELLVQIVWCHWNGVLQDHEHNIRYFVPVEFMPH